MDLRQQVDVEFVFIGVQYHDDVSFHYGRNVFPCPACGFEVFDEPVGSYDICSICDWEDDEVQLRFPLLAGGANAQSLCEWQKRMLKQIPADMTEHNGFHRCPDWRPLTEEDCRAIEGTPTSGRQYFDALGDEQVSYYWRR
ncbi:MAG: hydrolase [Planctomycetes bacterium]|nr:hydrolase [Planctomycetota bacterium]